MTPFITTFTGRKVNPLDLKVKDICIEDIGHHLAILNRFVGATREPVSIGQHSVQVYRLLIGSGWECEGLFHDSPETYLGDVSKWVKRMSCMAEYRAAEDRAWHVICEALKLRPEGNPEVNLTVKHADDLMVRIEHLHAGHTNHHMFALASHPRPSLAEIARVDGWHPWTWQKSKTEFMRSAAKLGF